MNDLFVDNELFVIPLSFGLIFVFAGYFMLKFPPKEINGLYGYRTASSMKSKERWEFSQVYAAKEMIKIGFINILLAVFLGLLAPAAFTGVIIGLAVMLLSVVILFIRVERAINTRFKKEQ